MVPPLFLFSHIWIAEMKSKRFYLSTVSTLPIFLLAPAYMGIGTILILSGFSHYKRYFNINKIISMFLPKKATNIESQ